MVDRVIGGDLQDGTVARITSGGSRSLGDAPDGDGNDHGVES